MGRLLAERSDTESYVKLDKFDPGFKRPTNLATLMSYDRTKQSNMYIICQTVSYVFKDKLPPQCVLVLKFPEKITVLHVKICFSNKDNSPVKSTR